MKTRIGAAVVLALTLAAGTAWAHHNMSAIFDFNQRFTRTGTLTKFDWRNPHILLSVDAKGEQGEMETWSFEGPSPIFFRTRNVGKVDFESGIGKTVTGGSQPRQGRFSFRAHTDDHSPRRDGGVPLSTELLTSEY